MAKSATMTLKITDCEQVYSGLNPKGHRYTIFEVQATKADGSPINEKLHSFEALPIGEEVLVNVTPHQSEQHGRSFTLHRKQSNNATAQINELKSQVEDLRERIEKLERLAAAAGTGVRGSQW